MKYSRTALKVLKAQYLSVLRKCALINAGLFVLAAPATAAVDVNNFNDFMTEWTKQSGDGTINITGALTATSDIGGMNYTPITINGNGHDINGNNHSGIYVNSVQTLNINNVGNINDKNTKGFYGFNSNSEGGVICNEGTIEELRANFTGNSANREGGAIHNYSIIKNLVGNFTGNSTNSEGGAIANRTTIENLNGTFTGNFAVSMGGAIYNNIRSTIKNLSGNFTGNLANRDGGAIFNSGIINIVADEQDTVFTGNTAHGVSNALNQIQGTTNLNTGQEHKIVFNDGIDGQGGSININQSNVKVGGTEDEPVYAPTTGVVEFNNTVANNAVNLYGGTLKLGHHAEEKIQVGEETINVADSYGNFDSTVNFNVHGGILSLQDDGVRTTNVGKLTLDSDLQLAIDADLAAQTSDQITGTLVNANGNNIVISDVNILTDSNISYIETQVADDNLKSVVELATDAQITKPSDKNYLLSYDNKDGMLAFNSLTNLKEAVAATDSDRVYTLNTDEDVTQELGAMGGDGSKLTINGNGHDINGNSNKGITVNSGQTLNINHVGDIADVNSKGFHGFKSASNGAVIYNNGTIENLSTNFAGNSAGYWGGAIYNEGAITKLSGNFSGNSANFGGAIYNKAEGIITELSGTFAGNSANNGSGGAIYNEHRGVITKLSGNFIGNSANFGGAIYNEAEGVITELSGTFAENSANNGNGGAIYNDKTITELSGNFTGNKAAWDGGAIYNRGNINIVADEGNTVFAGNMAADVTNALYQDRGVTNLNAGQEYKIIFNDGIDGNDRNVDQNIININQSGVELGDGSEAPTEGVVEFNNSVANNTVNLYDGTLKLGIFDGEGGKYASGKGNFEDSVVFNVHGGKLDLADGNIRETNLGNLNLETDLDLGIDVALSDEKADTITADSVSGDGKINISDFNILNDTDKNVVEVAVTEDDKLYNALSLGKTNVSVGDDVQKNYLITYDNGKLKFGNDASLETAVQLNTSAERVYAMGSSETLKGNFGSLAGTSLTVTSSGQTVNGGGHQGVTVAAGQTLRLQNTSLAGFNGDIVANSGKVELSANEYDMTIDGDISGTNGAVNVSGSKTVTLNGEISGNTVNLENGILALGNENALKNVTAFKTTGGTLDIGTKQVCTRDATFEKGSTLAVTVNTDEHGSFYANTLTVKDGANLKATLAQGLVDSETGPKEFELVGSENDWDDNFILAQDNNMYRFEKTDEAGVYVVKLAQTAEEVSQNSGGTANNANTAEAWVDGGKFSDGSSAQDLADKLAGLAQNSSAAFNDALTALAPEVSPVVKTASVDHSNQIFNAVSTRMSGGVVGSAAEGKSSGDSMLDGGATWVQLLANKTEFDGNRKAHGFDSKSAGVALGAEKQITPDTKAGAGYAYTNSDIDAFRRDIDVDTHTIFAYGEYKPSNWFVNGIASYSFADYDESKNVAGSRYKAKYDVDNIGLQVMTGYDTAFKEVNLTPVAGLRYNRIHRDSYTDTADQRVSSDTMDVLTAVAGVKVGKDFTTCKGTHWRPEARLAMTYDITSDKENAVVGLLNGSSYFVEGERLDRFGIEAGLGLTVDVNDNVEAAVGYEGRFREDYTDHTGMISAKYKF